MFENETDFKKLVDRLNIDTRPNPAHREKLRRQMLSAFQESEQGHASRKTPFRWVATIMSSPITKLAAAAAIVVAALIAIHQFGGSTDSTTRAFAEMKQAMEEMPWMHVMSREYHDGDEQINQQWLNFASKMMFKVTSEGSIWCWDYGPGQKQYFYNPSIRTVTISELPKGGLYGSNSPYNLLDILIEYMAEEGASIEQHSDKFNNRDAKVYEVEKTRPDEAMSIGRAVVAKMKFTIIADIQTKLLIAGGMRYLDKNNEIITHTKWEIDYPQTGPQDIYELGVPRTANIIDKTKEPVVIPTPGYELAPTPDGTDPR
jgi:hypothetical protein